MSIFAIGDLHLSLSVDKPMDIFGGWENYTERLKSNWEKIVTPNDTVVIPGDISWAMKLEDAEEDFKFLDSLPGTKIILKGNHDLWWDTVNKLNIFFQKNKINSIKIVFNSAIEVEDYAICGSRGWFSDSGEQNSKVMLRECQRLATSIEKAIATGKEPLVFLHYPPIYTDFYCDKIFEVLKEYGITKVYYGHLHGNSIKGAISEYDGIKLKLVSADALHFTPFLVSK